MRSEEVFQSAAFKSQAARSGLHCQLASDQILREQGTLICAIRDARTDEMITFTVAPVGKQWIATFAYGALTIAGMSLVQCLGTVFVFFGHVDEPTRFDS